MKFQFSEQSKLHGRAVRNPIDGFAFVPYSEEGFQEYIFVYDSIPVPGPEQEPDLYKDAEVTRHADDEIELKFEGLEVAVMLLSRDADNRFRKEHPETVAENEMFVIES